jgi:phytoene dehydrogenase-like protein
MPKRRKAIVVGARLAHAGFDVEVYEKNEFSGGRCSLIHHNGYRFDQVAIPIITITFRVHHYYS